jgi:Resolvase, N terminal domain
LSEPFVIPGYPKHRLLRFGVRHLLRYSARFLGSVAASVLRVEDTRLLNPTEEAHVIRHFQERMPYGLFMRDVNMRHRGTDAPRPPRRGSPLFRSLKDAWADTTTPHGRLMLTVLGGLAEFERELIRARTDDGRTRAKARGVKFGRPVKLTAHQRKEAIQRLAEGAVQADLARSYGVSQATISRLAAPSPFEPSPAGVL